mgnify:CR=1 FL=1|tara:strand:- start:781 stop:1026 length:246 start_codon:yes stop_codon:yes gene_type:complete
MLKRLTVHLENVKPTKEKVGNEGKLKTILNNTLSVRNLRSEAAISTALSDIRNTHTIAICKTPSHKTWKAGDEMWYTSNEK